MKRTPHNFNILSGILAMAMIGSMLFSSAARAAVDSPLDLATIPLSNSPTIAIEPNLLFILDDSGSMGWDYMPDYVNNTSYRYEDSLQENASFNTIAYNPTIRYLPPVNFTAAGLSTTTYQSQTGISTETGANTDSKPNWRRVKNNPYLSTATSNLESDASYYHVTAGEYCTRRDLKVCVAQSAPSETYPYPAPVRWCRNNTEAAKTVPGAGTCQAARVTTGTTYTSLRMPAQYSATIRITGASSTPKVNGVVVDGQQIMYTAAPGDTNTTSTIAQSIVDRINACTTTIVGNCTVAGYSATRSSSTVIIHAPHIITATPALSPAVSSGTLTSTISSFGAGSNVPGVLNFTPILSSVDSYPLPGSSSKASTRTDCAASICTYAEEMTNYANWWAYYHTRMQMMKTAVSLAFKDVGDDFRVGFMTINTTSGKSLDFGTFNTAQKAAWYSKLFSTPTGSGTPLRYALSRAGRIYANKEDVGGVFSDPMQYECQQNFSLLTSDGFWNGSGGYKLDGSAMTNQDGGDTPRPYFEGPTASSDSLADAAKYYYDTDLRDPSLSNCTGALGTSVCQTTPTVNKVQRMVTLSLGLGVDGTLAYATDYKTAEENAYADIKNGTQNWPVPKNDDPTAIDDLWHAAVNGNGTYFSAKNPTDLVNQLKDALAAVAVKVGAGAAAATSTLNPVAGDNFGYVASYTTGLWTGNLEKRGINTTTGAFGATALSCVEDVLPTSTCTSPSSILADGSGGYNCVTPDIPEEDGCAGGTWDSENYTCSVPVAASCSGTLKNKVGEIDDTRTIYMNVGGSLAPFSYGNLNASQKTTFESAFLSANLSQWSHLAETLTADQLAAASGANLVNYIRGQKAYEETSSDPGKRLFRKRQAVLGDIIDSTPTFSGVPTFSYSDQGYASFKSSYSGTGVVYVGANDGMLHAFDAETLVERWAYVPSMVIPNLWKLADTAYASKHIYYANGAPTISDICVSGCNSAGAVWKTILVAGLNGGGRGYYALDITNPGSPSLMWEFDASDEPNLGFTYGTPVITKNPDGDWVVLVTSGYNNIPDNSPFYDDEGVKFKPNNPAQFTTGDGKGYLFILNAVTGVKTGQITTGVGNLSVPSGLAKISAWADDPEVNNTATYVYGGDLLGNLWRFDLSDNSVMKFADLGSTQPITVPPELGLIQKKRVVFVGSGKYLEVSDLTNLDLQTLYAIKDDDSTTTLSAPKSSLEQQTLVTSGSETRQSGDGNDVNWDTGLGWYVDFPDGGERQHVASELVLGTLLVPTTVPTSSACQPAGYGWLNALDYRTGRKVPDAEAASWRGNAPIVGFNVVSIGGKPKVNVVTADDPNPKLLDNIKFTGSGTGFQKTRAIWRELIRK